MNITRAATGMLAAAFLATSAGAQDASQTPAIPEAPDFSTDMVSRIDYNGHIVDMQSKMFKGKDKVRVETQVHTAQGTTNGVSITRMDKGVIWIILPQQKSYMEMKLKPADIAKYKEISAAGEGRGKFIDTLKVDGKQADRYDIAKASCKGYSYFQTGTMLPMKIDLDCGAKHTITDFRNMKVAAQPQSLFEVPAGYKLLNAPGKPQMPSQVQQ